MKIWDFSFVKQAITLEGHPDAVYDISCSPTDGNLVGTCGRQGMLILWDLRAKGQLFESHTTGPNALVLDFGLEWSSDKTCDHTFVFFLSL